MAKSTSKLSSLLGRFVKGLVGALLIPPVIGLAVSVVSQFDELSAGTRSCGYWFLLGLIGYAGTHLLLYRPRQLFALNHALLDRLAVWLFGGQVATVGSEGAAASSKKAPKPSKAKKGKGDKDGGDAPAEASTLVVISPYLVPLYTGLVSLLAWVAAHWGDGSLFRIITSAAFGISLGFHICMTGEDLQEHAEQFPIETRLMALAISILASVSIAALCAPVALPDFSVSEVFAKAGSHAHQIYAGVASTLFGLK